MPPSPAMRVSPARELRTDNHKRGRSLESGILFQEKDDDLALFNEVQDKERENYLLQSNDDLDDIFSSKLRYFSDIKIGISAPARGESSDLLYAEGDKNDYDWLITPPETPLFRTLDDEAAPVSFAPPRGRPRSQPVSLSRSSTMEKTYRSTKGSPSPQRLSPSPRSSNNTLNSRNRPFSSTHASPPPPIRSPSPSIRSPSPSRRLSPPPSKPSPAPRSSTPTPRRMSTGSSGVGAPTPSRVRGTSPVKTSRGNSASPKIRAWQSNIPGFSLEAPPNLRTSLADRPASYVRGSSPASRNGSRSGRQSMSPNASRSVSSCQSRDRDQFSNYSKGSVASSGDDDVESIQSISVRSMNNRAMGVLKKTTKVLSSSAPKRSFDLALRQMERKGGPQNMFRPLLSSVPSSTFYAGKTNTNYRPLTSKNSSITTSSNASSDQGTSGALDIEEIEQNQEDVTSDLVKGKNQTMHDEIFVMDLVDEAGQNGATEESTCLDVAEDNSSSQFDIAIPLDSAGVILNKESEYSDFDGAPHMEICSKCSRRFKSSELTIEGDQWLCLECKTFEENKTSMEKGVNTTEELEILECGAQEVQEPLQDGEMGETHLEKIDDEGQDSFIEPSKDLSMSSLKPDVQEGTGISLLLKKSSISSSSSKGYLVQSRSFTASNISYDDFAYVRDSLNSMRSSIGHSSASVSSSVDLGSSKYGRKSDMENYRYETPVKHKRSVSSLSGISAHGSHVPSIAPSFHEDSFENGVKCPDPNKESLASECTEAESTCTDVEKENRIISKTAHLTPDDSEYGDNLTNYQSNLISEEISGAVLHVSTEAEDAMQSLWVNEVDVVEVEENVDVTHPSSLDVISEMEIENADIVCTDSDSGVDSKHELVENSVSVGCNNDIVSTPVEEVDVSVPVNGVLEESTIVLEGLGETKPRSFSLEEATDTILFCSSIVHNLAYEAANIAIDKEDPHMEPLRPAVTFVGKPNSDRRDNNTRSRTKRGPKSQKTRQRKTDLDTKASPVTVESDGKSTPRIVRSSPSKSDSMIPPKLESKCNCTIM